MNGKTGTTGLWIEVGFKIELIDLEINPPSIYELSLEVVYEDDDIAVINKPGGIVVNGNQFRTIQNMLLYNLHPSKVPNALKIPRPVHRLDAPTCGLLLIAKTQPISGNSN